ncbi:hypothetical protein PFISCL1PPCAC_19552, partial [Pristionchus fissidentatus]
SVLSGRCMDSKAMNAVKKLLTNKGKKKRTVDEDGGGATTAAGGGGGGPLRFKSNAKHGKDSNKEKKPTSGSCEQKGKVPSDGAPAAAPGAEGGRPLIRKKKSNFPQEPSKMQTNEKPATSGMLPVQEPAADAVVDPEKDVRSAAGRDPDEMTEEQMKNLRAYIAQYEALGVKGLLDEFETIKGYNLTPFDITTHEANPTKNRYKDIFCVEPSRVKLTDGKEGDYVHANHVKGAPFINQFVTTQGPIEATVNDFWRLVVQENVGYIFMLCSIIELGKKKCEVYYPETEGETKTYIDVKVTLENKREDAHFINSKFILEIPGKPKRYLYHHYWKNWPDRGVPITALAGLRLLRHARLTNYSSIVHCSAGVGRTGTLVAIEWLMQKILTTPPPYDMKEMLKAVRNQRAHAIQTAPQYAYIAFAIFRLIAMKDPSTVKTFMKFSVDMQTHTGVKIDGGAAGPTPPAAPAAAAPTPAP